MPREHPLVPRYQALSVRLHRKNPRDHPNANRCPVYDYLLAGCPSVVGCLWSAEGEDFENYVMLLLEELPLAEHERNKTAHLSRAMFEAIKRCRYHYFTGFSVVAYGLPTTFVGPRLCR